MNIVGVNILIYSQKRYTWKWYYNNFKKDCSTGIALNNYQWYYSAQLYFQHEIKPENS